jgi:hypothetical protein
MPFVNEVIDDGLKLQRHRLGRTIAYHISNHRSNSPAWKQGGFRFWGIRHRTDGDYSRWWLRGKGRGEDDLLHSKVRKACLFRPEQL